VLVNGNKWSGAWEKGKPKGEGLFTYAEGRTKMRTWDAKEFQ
jgi:hypothetical protein